MRHEIGFFVIFLCCGILIGMVGGRAFMREEIADACNSANVIMINHVAYNCTKKVR